MLYERTAAERRARLRLIDSLYPGSFQADVDGVVARVMASVEAQEAGGSEVSSNPFGWRVLSFSGRRAAAIACALLFLVAGPILAYTAGERWREADGADSGAVATPSADNGRVQSASLPGPARTGYREDAGPVVENRDETVDAGLAAVLDRDLVQQMTKSMLLQNEEQCEAWARKEYPLIMWLYDSLSGALPASSSTAESGIDDAAYKEGPLWDGVPVQIPEWAQRLFADTPEDERPTGWRALLVYSGEIFRFDYPKSTDDSNVVPTIEGLFNAARVTGVDFDAVVDRLLQTDVPPGTQLEAIVDLLRNAPETTQERQIVYNPILNHEGVDLAAYKRDLLADVPLSLSVLTYIYVSSRLVKTCEFEDLADFALVVAVDCCIVDRDKGYGDITLLPRVLDGRNRLLAQTYFNSVVPAGTEQGRNERQ